MFEVSKPGLWVSKPGLGPNLETPTQTWGPKTEVGVATPRLGRGCLVDIPNHVTQMNTSRESPIEGPRLAFGC